MDWLPLVIGIIVFILAPFIGMLIIGLDRKITARLQNRIGPPVLQPFYDAVKLFGKSELMVNRTQMIFAVLFFSTVAFATLLLCLRADLLLIFLILSTGVVFFALGAYSVKSGFSFVGGNREVYQMLAYEPVFLIAIFAMGYATGSFNVVDIFKLDKPLIMVVPLALAAMVIVLMIKMQKSPFDISTAHTEVISGPMVDYSGKYLALIKVTHWYELSLLLGIMALFLVIPGNMLLSVVLIIVMIVVVYFVLMVLDNVTPRLTWKEMVVFSLAIGMTLVGINIFYLALTGGA
jgi:ech hydrogenase subunit B